MNTKEHFVGTLFQLTKVVLCLNESLAQSYLALDYYKWDSFRIIGIFGIINTHTYT